jgi:AcrR family transcriptional regulator
MSTSGRDSYHHGDLRPALVEAAVAGVRDGGWEGFSLRRAASALGVSPSAVYRHFADKAALLDAVAEHGFAALGLRMEAAGREARAGRPPREAAVGVLAAYGRVHVEWAAEEPLLFRTMFGLLRSRSGAAEQEVGAKLLAALADLISSGAVPPERFPRLRQAGWPAFHGLACLRADGLVSPGDADDALRAVTVTLLEGVGVDPTVIVAAGVPED